MPSLAAPGRQSYNLRSLFREAPDSNLQALKAPVSRQTFLILSMEVQGQRSAPRAVGKASQNLSSLQKQGCQAQLTKDCLEVCKITPGATVKQPKRTIQNTFSSQQLLHLLFPRTGVNKVIF